jgi:hypothetical protein
MLKQNLAWFIELFAQEFVTNLSKIWVQDPGSGKLPIPDPGFLIQVRGTKRHRIRDPDLQHWSQDTFPIYTVRFFINYDVSCLTFAFSLM